MLGGGQGHVNVYFEGFVARKPSDEDFKLPDLCFKK
jgi:hypothetical protein